MFFSPPALPNGMQSPMALPLTPKKPESTSIQILSAFIPLISRLLLLSLGSFSLFSEGRSVFTPSPIQHFMLESINDRYTKDRVALKMALAKPPRDVKTVGSWKGNLKKRKRQRKRQMKMLNKENSGGVGNSTTRSFFRSIAAAKVEKPTPLYDRTVIVIDLNTEKLKIKDAVEYLRDIVSFILCQYFDKSNIRLDMGKELEVIFNVQSPGGSVQDFGLAADQIARLRNVSEEHGDLIVTVCVDKIAASGGYMIASQASRGQLFAAPFAVLGSIGVVTEIFNFRDVLEKNGVRSLILTAGNEKVPLSPTGKVTKQGLDVVQAQLDAIHDQFRRMVSDARGKKILSDNLETVMSGNIFSGQDAHKFGMIDRIITSDRYIHERVTAGDRVLKLLKHEPTTRLSALEFLLRSKPLIEAKFNHIMTNVSTQTLPLLRTGAIIGLLKYIGNKESVR